MNISSAFIISQSGLRSTEQRANLVSGNIANAQGDGYVRREGVQASAGAAERGSVVTLQIVRQVDDSLSALTRNASAKVAGQQTRADLLQGYLASLGDPGDEISPAARLAEFQTSMDLLANNPSDSDVQLDTLGQADTLVRTINDAATALDKARITVGDTLTRDVGETNEILSNIAVLNAQINGETSRDVGHADLMDQIGRELDKLGGMMDLSVRWTEAGQVAVHTGGGTQLVIGDEAAKITYRVTDGTLRAGDIDITPQDAGARGFSYGRLSGLMQLAKDDIPRMQTQLDEMARALIQTFEGADESLAPGQAGLFTDGGNALDPTRTDDLALRLAVNDAVRPQTGGALWRLRDGIGATTEGAPSSTRQISAFITALDAPQTFDGTAGLGTSQPLDSFASALVSDQQNVKVDAENRAANAAVEYRSFEDARGSVEGVNIDAELQKLLAIEQSYAANSQVLTTLSGMLDTLLRSF